jgi:hypothetical protein
VTTRRWAPESPPDRGRPVGTGQPPSPLYSIRGAPTQGESTARTRAGRRTEAAARRACLAWVRFMDGRCPFPKACDIPRKTVAGGPFPHFHSRGGRLMHALALAGDATR